MIKAVFVFMFLAACLGSISIWSSIWGFLIALLNQTSPLLFSYTLVPSLSVFLDS